MKYLCKSLMMFTIQWFLLGWQIFLVAAIFQPCITLAPFTTIIWWCEEWETTSTRCNPWSLTCDEQEEANASYSQVRQLLTSKKITPIIWRTPQKLPRETLHRWQEKTDTVAYTPRTESYFLLGYVWVTKKTE